MSEEIAIADEEMGEEIIKKVGFTLRVVEGQCCRCKEEGEVVEITAFIYYPQRNEVGQMCVAESRWNVQYCEWCMRKILHPDATQEDFDDGMLYA